MVNDVIVVGYVFGWCFFFGEIVKFLILVFFNGDMDGDDFILFLEKGFFVLKIWF